MLKRFGLVVTAAVAILLVVAPSTAAAQDKTKSVMAGVTFTTPGDFGIGFQGAVDLPTTMKMGKADMSILVGGFFVKLDGWSIFGGGGGLKWEFPVNEKARAFFMIIAGIGRDDIDTSFAFSPGAGVLFNVGTDMDFFASVGLGSINYGGGSGNHVGAHITVGINKKLGG
jgi:hypothetical protein